MSVDLEELRHRYEGLTDEALLAIPRQDLVAEARQCLDAELGKRGLEPADLPAAPGPDTLGLTAEGVPPVATDESIPPGENWALLGDFHTADEVSIAVALLRSAGIESYTPSQDPSRVNPLGIAEGMFRVFVPAGLVAESQEILDTPISDEELAAQAEAAALEDTRDIDEDA